MNDQGKGTAVDAPHDGSTEYRLRNVENDTFRTGEDLAALKQDLGHVKTETSGLAAWLERHERVSDQRHDALVERFDALDTKVDRILALLEDRTP
ncbi:hypothetical protein [Streptomyces albiaxialis]|uniref:hypothetical protein n=1 Tax=Streptomyces albiaxialis TaxID=329523 RepID=UPI0031DCDCF4